MWYPCRDSGRKLHALFVHPFSRSLSLSFLSIRALMKLISLVLFLSAVRTDIGVFLASIGMVIRVLGQGEPLGTRGCVSVGDEGRTSGFDVFEFGNRESVCGGKRKERSLKLVFHLWKCTFSLSSATSSWEAPSETRNSTRRERKGD